MADDHEHPILDTYGPFTIEELVMVDDDDERSLVLLLRRDSEEFRLRFWSPERVDIAPEFEPNIDDFVIYDVTGRGIDGLGVWAVDRKRGTIEFFARAVEFA